MFGAGQEELGWRKPKGRHCYHQSVKNGIRSGLHQSPVVLGTFILSIAQSDRL